MPNLANAKKALRQNLKRASKNQVTRDQIHSMRRNMRKLIDAGKLDEAKALVADLDQKVDKAAKKNIIPANAASRIKSRYMLSLNKAMAAKK